MLHLNNNASKIKREILIRLTKLQLEGKLEEGAHYIPREMAPVKPIFAVVFTMTEKFYDNEL